MTDTPCEQVCTLNANQICIGCGRTVDEITTWTHLNLAEKQQVNELAKIRLKTIVERQNANKR